MKGLSLIFTATVLVLAGCSAVSRSKNLITTNNMSFKTGIKGNEKWYENLSMKRVSWYQGANMAYDLIIGELKDNSQFTKWLGKNETDFVSQCDHLWVALLYADSNQNRSVVTLTSQMEAKGLRRVSMPVFAQHLSGHFTYNDRQLHHHRFMGFCQDSTTAIGPVTYEVPGFLNVELKF